MSQNFTQSDLEAYLDEELAPEETSAIEDQLRASPQLAQKLSAINSRRDAGIHSVGAIWRRHRITCPSREQLGSYLLGILSDEEVDYLEFHLEKVGCRYCQANVNDLRAQQAEATEEISTRRRKYFQSSAGYLRPEK